jgi:hypothetical protein
MPRLLTNEPFPVHDYIVRRRRPEFVQQGKADPLEDKLTEVFANYFVTLGDTVNASAVRIVDPVQLSTQGASVAATDFSGGGVSQGLYRIGFYQRITRAATVSSSLTLAFDWVDGGLTQTETVTAMTGNTTTTQDNGFYLIHADAASPVRYTTTYASVGATSMQYALFLTLERVGN